MVQFVVFFQTWQITNRNKLVTEVHDIFQMVNWTKIFLKILKSPSQYQVCPPHALITAVHLRLTEPMTCVWKSCGMSYHTRMRVLASCHRSFGCWGSWRNRRSISYQTCSIGLRSGEFACHGRTLTLFWLKTQWKTLALWGRALSCWNIMPGPCWHKNRITICSMILSWSLFSMRLPSTLTQMVQ